MTFYERLENAIREKGETIKSTERNCGIANATIKKWQTQSPRLENVEKIAKYLNISIDWLVFGTEDKNKTIDSEEEKLLNNFRKLNKKDKKEIEAIINIKLEQQNPEGIILNSKIG